MAFTSLSTLMAFIAIFGTTTLAAPATSGAGVLDLAAYEAAFSNPEGLPTAWVVDCSEGAACDITKGRLVFAHELTPQDDPDVGARSASPADLGLEDRGIRDVCSSAHQAVSSVCVSAINALSAANVQINSGQTRSFCVSSGNNQCCISWSANATFNSRDLASDAAGCYNVCASANVSCEAYGATLGGKVLDVCLSNRPNGCS